MSCGGARGEELLKVNKEGFMQKGHASFASSMGRSRSVYYVENYKVSFA